MSGYRLAQINIGRMRAPLDDPMMHGFVARLEEINQLAEAAPGFVWRLQSAEGDATALRPFEDERILINMSVWESIETLQQIESVIEDLAAGLRVSDTQFDKLFSTDDRRDARVRIEAARTGGSARGLALSCALVREAGRPLVEEHARGEPGDRGLRVRARSDPRSCRG